MDYEKLYKESLERAKIWQDHLNECGDKDYADELNYIFPELAESEDERVRKELVTFLEELSKLGKDTNFDRWKTSDCANWIAWLEKQASPQMVADAYLRGCDDTEKKWLKKQSEQKAFDYENVNIQQKDFAPVEPKFKVGDWIMDKESKEVFYISKNLANTYKIVDIEGNDYHVPHYILEEDYDVWAIQDAKDGDVLYCESGNIEYFVMNKGVNENGNIDSYFRYNTLNDFGVDIPSVLSAKCDNITPATKEQRNLLFQKMKEAGYAWDAKKKELKKIETKTLSYPIWHPADGDYLPEIDRSVIVLTQKYPLEGSEYAVSFAHRTAETKRYGKAGWNIPNVKWWLDCDLPTKKQEDGSK